MRLDEVVGLCSDVCEEKDPTADSKGKQVLKNIISRTLEFPSSTQQTPPPPPECWSWWLPHPGLGFEHLKMFWEENLGSSSVIWGILRF